MYIMSAPATASNDKDIEMGIPGEIPVPPTKEKNCWGRTFTDFSMGVEAVITTSATVAGAWSYVYGQYVVAGISTGIFVLSIANTVRIHCLGRMKDQNTQNKKLATNINNLSKEKLDLENAIQSLQDKITLVEKEKQNFANENDKINSSLSKKVKEIKKLNAHLSAAEKKASEFQSLYDQFKALESELSKHTSSIGKEDNDLHHVNEDLGKEKNDTHKLNDTLNANNKKFDNENEEFTGNLKELQQLVASTQQQIKILQKSYAEIKVANEELQKREAVYAENEKQYALKAQDLKQAEMRLTEFNKKFKKFIEKLRTLSVNIPELKPILENMETKINNT